MRQFVLLDSLQHLQASHPLSVEAGDLTGIEAGRLGSQLGRT